MVTERQPTPQPEPGVPPPPPPVDDDILDLLQGIPGIDAGRLQGALGLLQQGKAPKAPRALTARETGLALLRQALQARGLGALDDKALDNFYARIKATWADTFPERQTIDDFRDFLRLWAPDNLETELNAWGMEKEENRLAVAQAKTAVLAPEIRARQDAMIEEQFKEGLKRLGVRFPSSVRAAINAALPALQEAWTADNRRRREQIEQFGGDATIGGAFLGLEAVAPTEMPPDTWLALLEPGELRSIVTQDDSNLVRIWNGGLVRGAFDQTVADPIRKAAKTTQQQIDAEKLIAQLERDLLPGLTSHYTIATQDAPNTTAMDFINSQEAQGIITQVQKNIQEANQRLAARAAGQPSGLREPVAQPRTTQDPNFAAAARRLMDEGLSIQDATARLQEAFPGTRPQDIERALGGELSQLRTLQEFQRTRGLSQEERQRLADTGADAIVIAAVEEGVITANAAEQIARFGSTTVLQVEPPAGPKGSYTAEQIARIRNQQTEASRLERAGLERAVFEARRRREAQQQARSMLETGDFSGAGVLEAFRPLDDLERASLQQAMLGPGLTRAQEGPELEAVLSEAQQAQERLAQGQMFADPLFQEFVGQRSELIASDYARALANRARSGDLTPLPQLQDFARTKLPQLTVEFKEFERRRKLSENQRKQQRGIRPTAVI